MMSVCFDLLPDHSRQCEYAFARTVRANNLRHCETALTFAFPLTSNTNPASNASPTTKQSIWGVDFWTS